MPEQKKRPRKASTKTKYCKHNNCFTCPYPDCIAGSSAGTGLRKTDIPQITGNPNITADVSQRIDKYISDTIKCRIGS